MQALFFAAYRELLGASLIPVELPDGATVGDLVQSLRGRGPAFATLPADPAVAVNQAYAHVETVLAEGDEIAFIPPVAGG